MARVLYSKYVPLIICSFVLLFCVACTINRSDDGLHIGRSFNTRIEPQSSLTALYSGWERASIKSDTSLDASSDLSYVIYGGKNASDKYYAHLMVVDLGSASSWDFKPESYPRRNEFYIKNLVVNGEEWKEHFLFERSAGDWVSDLIKNNGRAVPEIWLAKRWSRTFFQTRMVAEYREPAPACMKMGDDSKKNLPAVDLFTIPNEECRKAVDNFHARSVEAFNFTTFEDAKKESTVSKVFQNGPKHSVNITRQVGEVISKSEMLFRSW